MDDYSAYIEGKLQAWLDMRSLGQIRIDGLQKERMKIFEAQAAPPAEKLECVACQAVHYLHSGFTAPTPAPETAPAPGGATSCPHLWLPYEVVSDYRDSKHGGPPRDESWSVWLMHCPKCNELKFGDIVSPPPAETSAPTTARPSTRDEG